MYKFYTAVSIYLILLHYIIVISYVLFFYIILLHKLCNLQYAIKYLFEKQLRILFILTLRGPIISLL